MPQTPAELVQSAAPPTACPSAPFQASISDTYQSMSSLKACRSDEESGHIPLIIAVHMSNRKHSLMGLDMPSHFPCLNLALRPTTCILYL